MVEYAREIAKAALEIGAITLSPENPYTWASGYRMPIYNDNRKHLRYPKNRRLITAAFQELIEEEEIDFDIMVAGTSTAGIAPASSLAQATGVPITIIENKLIHQYSNKFISSLTSSVDKKEYDIVVSTCPASIIPAVFIANERDLPFAYVRESQKAHGLQQQIEGIVKEHEKMLLLDFYNKYSYLPSALQVLRDEKVIIRTVISDDILPQYETPEIEGKRILQIEDLVSTGGSCIEEIKIYTQNWDGIIDFCLAIFSYEFPETITKFQQVGCKLKAALGYQELLTVALEMDAIKKQHLKVLEEWSEDPFGWGEKNGFPKVEK